MEKVFGNEAREARVNARNKYKYTDISIFVSSSKFFIDYKNEMRNEITLVYSSKISVTINNF